MENLFNRFVLLKSFFSKEHINDEAGLTPEERLQERQSLETKGFLIELHGLLDTELSKDSEFRSQYYTEALNYLNRFRKESFAYLDDGELPIDKSYRVDHLEADYPTQQFTSLW